MTGQWSPEESSPKLEDKRNSKNKLKGNFWAKPQREPLSETQTNLKGNLRGNLKEPPQDEQDARLWVACLNALPEEN